MTDTTPTKRQSGQVRNGKWLVLTESARNPDKSYVHKCGTDILGQTVAHTVRDGLFPLSGSGRCEYETVPYCPKCEEKPNYHGMPVTQS